MRAALAILALMAAATARGEDCARYEEPLAYNSCLARQGPAAHGVAVGKPPVGAVSGPVRARPPVAAPARVGRRGRNEMVFSPRR